MTLILLHGFTGRPASWSRVIEELPCGSPVRVEALLGHDPSAGDELSDFVAEVDRLAACLRRDGVRAAHVCGYSLGGRLALGLLARHRELFARATILSAHPGLADPAARSQRRASDQRWIGLLEEQGIDAFAEAWEQQPLFATQSSLPAAVREQSHRIRRSHDPRELARALRLVGLSEMPDWTTELPAIDCPVQWVVGELDVKFRALAEAGVARLPRGRFTVVPGAGHDLPLERPAAVARALTEEEP